MNNRSEKILNSLDGLKKAGAPDFFYTRLLGRMQPVENKKRPALLIRPVFVIAMLFAVLITNVFSIISFDKAPQQKLTIQPGKAATIESFAEAYNLNTTSVYE